MSVTVDRQGALGLGRLSDRPLREADPEVHAAPGREPARRCDTLEMIAGENFAPLAAQGSVLTNEYVDMVEQLATDRVEALLRAEAQLDVPAGQVTAVAQRFPLHPELDR